MPAYVLRPLTGDAASGMCPWCWLRNQKQLANQIRATQIPRSSNSNVACCTRPFPSSRAGDAIHPVLQEVGLGDSETKLVPDSEMSMVTVAFG